MYCSNCGMQLAPGQSFCPQCGRPVAPTAPPIPGLEFALDNYRGKLRALSIVWLVYAAVTLLLGFAGLTFARAFFAHGHFGPWIGGPVPPAWMPIIHLAWIALSVRTIVAVVAAWGLMEHAAWGRILAIIVAIISLLHFPLGTALGIWTLVMLLGSRNTLLYEQL